MPRPTIAIACLFLSGCSSAPPPSASHPMLGHEVAVALPTDSGSLVSIPPESDSAQSYVLDFWAPTCVPCRTATPALVAKKAELDAHGARLVLVAVLGADESTEHARDVLSNWGVQAPFLVDRSEASKSQLGVLSLPATLIIDGKGKLRWSAPPNASAEDVVKALATTAP